MSDEILQLRELIAKETRVNNEQVGWTNPFTATLGRANSKVIVPPSEAVAAGAYWCYQAGFGEFQAIDRTGGQLTYDDTQAGYEVECGYAPGEVRGRDIPSIIRLTDRGRLKSGGATPMQAGLQRAQYPQMEDMLTLRPFLGTPPFGVGLTEGKLFIGDEFRVIPTYDDFVDLAGYESATPDYSRFVIVCIDADKQPVVVDRGEFEDATVTETDIYDVQLPAEAKPLFAARFPYGISEFIVDNFIPLAYTSGGTTSADSESGTLEQLNVEGGLTNTILQTVEAETVLAFNTVGAQGTVVTEIKQATVETTDGTDTTIHSFTLPSDTNYLVKVVVVARMISGTVGSVGDSAALEASANFKNVGGTVSIVGTPPAVVDHGSDWSWTIVFDVSGSDALIQVQGAANQVITWHATLTEYKL